MTRNRAIDTSTATAAPTCDDRIEHAIITLNVAARLGRQACCASPRLAWLFSSLSLSLSRSPHRLAVLLILSLSSLSLSPLSLSLSLFGAGSIPSHEMSIHARSLLASFAPHTLGGGVLMATFTISRAATHEGQEAGRAARRPPSQASSQGRPHPNAEAAPRPLRETRKRSALPPPPALPASQPAPS